MRTPNLLQHPQRPHSPPQHPRADALPRAATSLSSEWHSYTTHAHSTSQSICSTRCSSAHDRPSILLSYRTLRAIYPTLAASPPTLPYPCLYCSFSILTREGTHFPSDIPLLLAPISLLSFSPLTLWCCLPFFRFQLGRWRFPSLPRRGRSLLF